MLRIGVRSRREVPRERATIGAAVGSGSLRNDLLRSYRSALVVSVTAALVALVVSSAGAYDGDVGQGPTVLPCLLHRRAIRVGHDRHERVLQRHAWPRDQHAAFLLLPASALEKTVSRLLIHTVGLIVFLLVFTTVLSGLLEGINALWIGERRAFFSPLDRVAWMLVPHFLVAQALFFLGAAWFRKVQFVKTVGVALGIVIGLLSPSPHRSGRLDASDRRDCLNADWY